MDNDNNIQTHRGMIVLDQADNYLVSITGHDKLYSLSKSDKNCMSVFEPLSRFEFEASFTAEDQVQINELIRFDNVLKIKHKDSILNLLASLQDDMQNNVANINSLNDLQTIYKREHIPYSVYGFDKLRSKFWVLDLGLKISELEQSGPGKLREGLIDNLNKRTFMFENNPDYHQRYLDVLESFKKATKTAKDSFDKENRILLAESEAPKVGEWVEFPFLTKIGKVLIKTIGKSFLLTTASNTVTEATKKRLSGKMVCWVYYESKGKTQAFSSATAQQSKSDDKLNPRSINELDHHFERIKKLFILDGIKPRNSNSFVGDFRTGVEICDMRPLNKTYWFVVSTDNIWYLDGEESTALMHHNILLGGHSYLGYVLTKADYADVLNTLNWLNTSVIEIRKKINETKF